MIEAYQFGSMTINGQNHRKDLKIIDGNVKPNWWRNEGHRVDEADMEDILSAKPATLVIGQGHSGNMRIADSLRAALEEAGIRLIEGVTGEVLEDFNRLHREGKNVAGAFHLTC